MHKPTGLSMIFSSSSSAFELKREGLELIIYVLPSQPRNFHHHAGDNK